MSNKYLSTRFGKVPAIVAVISLVASFFLGFASPVRAIPTELFFSEYIEGSSYNKALEIYNGTGAAVDLSTYTLELYSNGAAVPSKSVALSGTLTDGDVFVIAHTDADPAILEETDQIDAANNVINFNGDDALVLKNGGVIIDVIGQIGVDPGSYWGSGGVTTADHTLRRKETIEAGDTSGGDAFDPSVEWDGYAKDTFDGLGSHSIGGPDYTPIYDIQYTEDPGGGSLYAGQTVTTQGIVTAVFFGDDCFIQDGAGAWNGLYLYNTCGDLNVGDRVEVVGAVSEFNGLTEISYGSVTVLSSGNSLPEPSVATTLDLNQEQWESVLVRVENVTITNPDLGNSEWEVDDGTGPTVVDDMGDYTYVPTLDDELYYVQGPLIYSYDAFKIEPRDDGDIGVPLAYTPIYDIQYTEDSSGDSPYAGQTVTTQGIVTAVFYGDDCFIQDGAGAWNGLYLYNTCGDLNEGDLVEVVGAVSEFNGLTEISYGSVTVLSSGNSLPDPSVVTTLDLNQEQWESVLVRVENVTVTDPDLGYDEWEVDDGSGPLAVDNLGTDTYVPVLDDEIDAIIGPLNYSYGAFKIAPRDDDDIILPTAPTFVINEIHADPDSSNGDANGDGEIHYSDDEFVEIVNISDSNIDISGWTLADYKVRHVFPAGTVVPAHCTILVFGGGSPSGVFGGAVVQTASTGALGLNNSGDTVTLNDGSTDQVMVTYGSEGGDNQSLTLDPDITGDSFVKHSTATGSGGALFSPGTMIDGSSFFGCFFCGNPATFIYEVQGSGSSSPLNGRSGVVIEGVVVGDFQTSDHLRGFFIQEEDGDSDSDPLTSDGVFVYDGSSPAVDVGAGDLVRIKGRVSEYYGLTQLSSISDLLVCGTGFASAATATLPVSSLDQWEQYEGMLIHIPQTLHATGNYNQGRYGEVDLSVGDRLDNPTNVVEPGAAAIALQDLNDRSRIQLEDGRTAQNPVPAPYMGLDNTLRAGDTIPELTGVLHYSFGAYELHPTEAVNFTRVNERTAAPPDVGGVLKVASFNVLNYFSTIDTGAWICGPAGDMECRGADSEEEFIRQRDKIIAAIVAMDADVIGLMEMENHPTDDALQDLVNGLNAAAGAGTYDFIRTGPIGADAIKVAFIYKTGAVTPVGDFAILDSSVDPTFLDTKNRPALAQTFERSTGGGRFTAVVNHLKSKGSDCNDLEDPDTGDGQGNCNLTRTSAAIALTNWLAGDPTGSGDPDYLIIGDLNAYAMEDPITAIKDAGYTNLIESFIGTDAYSYVFYGQAGYLDHALASADLTSRVMGVTEWHINADEPSALNYNDYNQEYLYSPDAYCSSDHDPVIVGFCDAIPPDVNVQVTPDTLWPPNHKYVTVNATVDVFDATGDTTLTLVSVTSNEPDDGLDDEDVPNDIVIVNDFTFKLRAERSDSGDGRVYTIIYQVTDACGNSTVATVTVTVPHNQGKEGD